MRRKRFKISKKDKRRNKIAKIVLLIILIIIIILLLLKRCGYIGEEPVIDTTPYEIRGMYEYNGKKYLQSNDRKTVLAIGTNGDDVEYLLLVVANKDDETLLPIHISRKTLCDYYDLDEFGKIKDTVNGNIENSFSNGTRDLVSLINVRDAVSDLFCNIRIDYCMMMDLKDIPNVVSQIGSTSFVLDDDFYDGKFTYKKGDTVSINPSNALSLIKGDDSKESVEVIEKRQNRYINSLFELGHASFALDENYFIKTLAKVSEYVSVSSNEILDLTNEVGSYPKLNLVHLEGKFDANGDFDVSEKALIKLCIDKIYK